MSWLVWILAQNIVSCCAGCSLHCQPCQVHKHEQKEDVQRVHSSSVISSEVRTKCPPATDVSMASEFVLLVTSKTLALLAQGFPWRGFSFSVSAARQKSILSAHILFRRALSCPCWRSFRQGTRWFFPFWCADIWDRLLCRKSTQPKPRVWALPHVWMQSVPHVSVFCAEESVLYARTPRRRRKLINTQCHVAAGKEEDVACVRQNCASLNLRVLTSASKLAL